MRLFTRLLAVVLTLGLIGAACGSDDDDSSAPESAESADESTSEPAEEDAPGTIVEVATEAGDFSTLVAAVDAAGLVDTLSGEGPFTVFAPTDEAFAAALDSLGITADELLADPTLGDILTYHVLAGEVFAADVVTLDGEQVETVNGASVTITVDGETVMVNEANVIATDIEASNGVIHVIDAVLLPPA